MFSWASRNTGHQSHSETPADKSLILMSIVLQRSVQQWKLTVTGRLYSHFKIPHPFCTLWAECNFLHHDSGLGHVTYLGEWNMAEGTMYLFWAETLRDITVSANSLPTLWHSCMLPLEEYSPGSHCFFSRHPGMRATWSRVESMPNQPIPEPQILEWNWMFVVQCWDLGAFC